MVINILNTKKTGVKTNFECQKILNADILLRPDSKFKGPVKVSGNYIIEDNNSDVTVYADITFEIACLCDRCGIKVEKAFNFKLKELFVFGVETDANYAYNGEILDLEKAVTENIIANLPVQIICKEKCKGLCAACGANLNEKKCKCKAEEDNNPFAALSALKKNIKKETKK